MMVGVFVFLIFAACTARAGDRFRYYVFDETKTDKLDYDHAHDLTIYDLPGRLPQLMFGTEYRIYGCAQDNFSYTVESAPHSARHFVLAPQIQTYKSSPSD